MKSKDYIKMRKLIKQKLKVTNIPKMKLFDEERHEEYVFSDFFEFKSFLGAGSFGFVVQAKDHDSEEMLAIKVSKNLM